MANQCTNYTDEELKNICVYHQEYNAFKNKKILKDINDGQILFS